MQNDSNQHLTIKDVIMSQTDSIAQLTARVNELERQMAVSNQKTSQCDILSNNTERKLDELEKTLNFTKGMMAFVTVVTGIMLPVLIFAGQSWVRLTLVDHEKSTVHHKDYYQYPNLKGPNHNPNESK